MGCPSETRLQAFVDGDLSPGEIDALAAHLDACDECRTLVGVVQPLALDDDTTTDHVGRYVLRRVLGTGGMGVVYEAVDPSLQRVVALKVLRGGLGDHESRLLREAEAMAKLSHPNVVTIHDVGRAEGRVYIVMELVRGTSLRHWLAREPRTTARIVDAFLDVARGLRAAHATGLVHRDVKPENVFVSTDGHVRVGDFGLAARLGEGASAGEGSLAYMAPEQRDGTGTDPRSDQYAFGVALGEAAAVAVEGRVPRWLARVVERATRARPDERFASMDEVIAALEVGRRRSRAARIALVALTVLALLAATVTFVSHRREGARVLACNADESALDAAYGTTTREAIANALTATASPLGAAAAGRATETLDRYARAWRDAHRRTCELARARDQGTAALLDRKRSCLGERLEILRAVSSSLTHADASMVESVQPMLELLPRIGACEDAREVDAGPPLPPPGAREATLAARRALADAAASLAAGRYAEGLTHAEGGFARANTTEYLPVLAEAYLWVGTAHGRLGHTSDAARALEHAASSASAARAQTTAIRAWIQLAHFVGYEAKRYEDGQRYIDDAKVALQAVPAAYELEAERLLWTRAMLVDQRRFAEALRVSNEETTLVSLRFGEESYRAAAALDGLAGILAGQCQAKRALEPQTKACAILEKTLGEPHPQVALCLANLGTLHAQIGDHARALEAKTRALAMFERAHGSPAHVGMARRNLVRTLVELGRTDEAAAVLTAAEASATRDSDHVALLVLRGELARRAGDLPAALTAHVEAARRTEAADAPQRIEPLAALATSELATGRSKDALQHASLASELAERVYGAGSCRIAEPLRLRAEALVAEGDAASARAPAERAASLVAGAELDPKRRAQVDLALAMALPATERSRARALAEGARAVLAREGGDPSLEARAAAWLGANP